MSMYEQALERLSARNIQLDGSIDAYVRECRDHDESCGQPLCFQSQLNLTLDSLARGTVAELAARAIVRLAEVQDVSIALKPTEG